MSNITANKLKALLAAKIIDFNNDDFIIILMKPGFVFNRATMHVLADVVADELGTGAGYTQDAYVLTLDAVTEDDTNHRCSVTWLNASWTAAAGDIGPVIGAIIYDDTVAAPVNKPLLGYIDFGLSYTQADGGTASITNLELRIS